MFHATPRRQTNPFGLSFLDLLCCGLGAMCLLFILAENKKWRSARLLEVEAKTILEKVPSELERQTVADMEQTALGFEHVAAAAPPAPRPIEGAAEVVDQITMRESIRSLVILIDVSGSMSSYLPDLPEFASRPPAQRQSGRKWQHACDLVARLLLTAPDLERFVVLHLSDNTTRRPAGLPIVVPKEGPWLPASAGAIQQAVTVLRALTPRGGSGHYWGIQEALRYAGDAALLGSQPPADTLVILTDGLPNHGPANDPHPDFRLNPDAGFVTAASRRARMTKTLELYRDSLTSLRAQKGGVSLRVHVICLPWPDDPDLGEFAMELAGPTQGTVLFPGMR